jgi:hypothetical protein
MCVKGTWPKIYTSYLFIFVVENFFSLFYTLIFFACFFTVVDHHGFKSSSAMLYGSLYGSIHGWNTKKNKNDLRTF